MVMDKENYKHKLYNIRRIAKKIVKLAIYGVLIYIILRLLYSVGFNSKISSIVSEVEKLIKGYKVVFGILAVALVLYNIEKIIKLIRRVFTANNCTNLDEFFIVVICCFVYVEYYKNIRIFQALVVLSIYIILFRFAFWKRRNENIIKDKNSKYLCDRYISNLKDDLLNRKEFVDNLKDAITNIKPSGSFVIGLNGKWGEGKTTILNFLYNELNLDNDIMLVKFNPWFYNTKDDIITGFYNSIAKQFNNKLMIFSLGRMLYKLRNVISKSFESKGIYGIVDILIPKRTSSKDVEELTKKISRKLTDINKKVVIFIDDLDRLDKEDLLLVFKLVKICGDIDNFIYILSFDKDQIRHVFENEIKLDHKYLEKIIQVSIDMPKQNLEVINVYLMNNIVKLFKSYKYDLNSEREDCIKIDIFKISKLFSNLREVKRYINRLAFYFAEISRKFNLDLYDGFILETIKFKFQGKYEKISQCKQELTQKKVNNEFLIKLYDKCDNKNILEHLIKRIFPNIDQYTGQINSLYLSNDSKETRVQNPSYFDYYFTLAEDKNIYVSNEVKKYLENLIQDKKEECNLSDLFNSISKNNSNSDSIDIINWMDYYLETCNKKSNISCKLILSIINQVYKYYIDTENMVIKKFKTRLVVNFILNQINIIYNRAGILVIQNIKKWEDVNFIYYLYMYCSNNKIKSKIKSILKNKLDEEYLDGNQNIFKNQHYTEIFDIILNVSDKFKIEKYFKKILDHDWRYIYSILNAIKINSSFKDIKNNYYKGKVIMLCLYNKYIIDIIDECIKKNKLDDENNNEIDDKQKEEILEWKKINKLAFEKINKTKNNE